MLGSLFNTQKESYEGASVEKLFVDVKELWVSGPGSFNLLKALKIQKLISIKNFCAVNKSPTATYSHPHK